MSTREERIEVFQDTMEWISENPLLKDAIKNSKGKTEVVDEDVYPSFARDERYTSIEVTNSRSFEAAMRLRRLNPDKKIAVLNFANAFVPGGGVTNGAGAQEECLCRCSTLYPLLYRKSLQNNYYGYHKHLHKSEATDRVIYTEDVIICKTDEDHPQRMDDSEWCKVDVITMAAPDLRDKYGKMNSEGILMTKSQQYALHVKRAAHMLHVAAAKGADILVLGAFGCGAFRNDPRTVASAYRAAIDQFPKVFDKIEFAVYCADEKAVNYKAFSAELSSNRDDKHSYIEEELLNKVGLDIRRYIDFFEREHDIIINYGDFYTDIDECIRNIESADYKLCCALMTALFREEHFCGAGSFEERKKEGLVDRILRRMLVTM